MALFIVLSYSISSVSSVAEAAEVGDEIETTDTSENSDSEYTDTDEFTGITERVEDATDVTDTVDTTDTTESTVAADSDKETDTSTEQGNVENPENADTSDKKDVSDKQDNESNAEVVSDSLNETKDNSDSLDADINEEESERSLHALITERNSTAEVSVLTSADESDVSVKPTSGIKAEEGLEVIKAYMFAERADNPEDDIWVKADPNERVSLEECETLSLYTIKNNTVDDVIVEDISEDSAPYAIDEDVTGVALVKDTGYRHLNLELDASEEKDDAEEERIEVHSNTDAELHSETDAEKKDDELQDKMVTLDGMMPKAVTAVAVDVTEKTEEEELKEQKETATVSDASMTDAQSKIVVAAYDISLTDGDTEYQPDDEHPIDVEIFDQRISKDSDLELWHIKDDGEKEQITDFTVEDGKVSFSAAGFSVYEIVTDVKSFDEGFGWLNANTIELIKKHGEDGFYVSNNNTANNAKDLYLTGAKTSGVSGNSDRDGLVTTSVASEPVPDGAVKFYFEWIPETEKSFYIYKMDGESKVYLKMTPVSGNESRAGITFATGESDKSVFNIIKDGNNLKISSVLRVNNKDIEYFWNMNTKTQKYGAIVGYNAKNDTNTYLLSLHYYVDLPDYDPYELDGLTYGLMFYSSGSTGGNALIANDKGNGILESRPLKVKGNTVVHDGILFVDENSEITFWTFTFVEGDKYTLSTVINGTTKYLQKTDDGLCLSDSEPTAFSVSSKDGKIRLSSDNKAVSCESNGFKTADKNNNSAKQWLNLVDLSKLTEDDFVTYAAEKVGISEVPNGKAVIVYTRVWNDEKKAYEFYAVDHDGTLYPCYERGNNIMWIGSQINTLLWDFTEYTFDDGTPNNYYELQNQYSEKYLAPQIGGGQVLADKKIGINMPGRADGEYYSTILAWDDPYYSYAGLQASEDGKTLESCAKQDADTFYFAVMTPVNPTLTTVETIQNSKYGITMKMVDFENRAQQNAVLGDETGFHEFTATQGILSNNIKNDGYPTTLNDQSLKELYKNAETVDHLFIASTYNASGYFEYDSCQNFASLKGRTGGDFTVYEEIGTMNTRGNNTDKHGQFMPYNDIEAGVYSTTNPYNLNDIKGNPLPESDPRKYEKLHRVGNANNTDATNWNFGMELEASFVQTPSGHDAWGHDIIFEFTGDDDFWLYVDNELVIDLGGIHSAIPGSVNFATGDVIVNGVKKTLRQVFTENYIARNENYSEADLNTYLAKYFDGDEVIFKDYTSHTMKIYYMERGEGASNLHMRFNLSYVTPGHVIFSKEVTGTKDMDFSLVQYPYQIWYKDEENGDAHLLTSTDNLINVTYQNSTQKVDYQASYTPPGSDETYQSVYFLYPGKAAEIHFPANTIEYKIIECGINNEVYDVVKVNDTVINGRVLGDSNRSSYDSGWLPVSQRPKVAYENHVDPNGLRTLSFQKKIYDENNDMLTATQDPTTFSFRLYLSNGIDDTLELADMISYCVKNPAGYLCYWDSENQTLKSDNKYREYSAFSVVEGDSEDVIAFKQAEKAKYTFTTSMNGSISKIPAWYTVEVPNLPVGVRFKVEERFSETPIGYGRTRYERENGSYLVEDGDGMNSGRIRANESPQMNVINKRGWGLQADKIWSDKNYTKFHETVYTAIYVDGVDGPLPDSIRELVYPDTYVRYFIENIIPGKTIADYSICEVLVTDPVVDEDGKVTSYQTLTKLEDGDKTELLATSKSTNVTDSYDYEVSYDKGTPKKSITTLPNENTRTDTITNTRTGGVVMTLYDMHTRQPLADGTFTLQRYDSENDQYIDEGTFVSDKNGRINILYEYVVDADYVLTQTASPKGYIGPDYPIMFSIDENDDIALTTQNDPEWQEGDEFDDSVDELIAYVNVYNRPYTLKVYKTDKDTNTDVPDAHFTLYRGRKGGHGGVVKDYNPMPGYEDMETDSDGLISDIDNNLPAGIYYLEESTPPPGYEGIDGDIKFEISALGGITILDSPVNSGIELVDDNNEGTGTYIYTLKIPNTLNAAKEVTITKTVVGNMGNKSKDFTFTFSVTGDDGSSTEYQWSKNNVAQTQLLHSGGTFTLSHGESVVINVPLDSEVTITENAEDYAPSFKLGDGEAESVNSKKFTVSDDVVLAVTNTRDGIVPSGIWISYGLMAAAGAAIFLFMLTLRRRRRRLEEELKQQK